MSDEMVNDLKRCNQFFVYGTLRKGQGNFFATKLSKAFHEGTVEVSLPFRMHSLGGFPALTRAEEHLIVGDLFTVEDITIFQSLDRLEGYPRFYNRSLITTPDHRFWLYHIDEEWVWDHPIVENGDWVEFKNNKNEVA